LSITPNLVNRQTNKPTNKHENISSLAEVTKERLCFVIE